MRSKQACVQGRVCKRVQQVIVWTSILHPIPGILHMNNYYKHYSRFIPLTWHGKERTTEVLFTIQIRVDVRDDGFRNDVERRITSTSRAVTRSKYIEIKRKLDWIILSNGLPTSLGHTVHPGSYPMCAGCNAAKTWRSSGVENARIFTSTSSTLIPAALFSDTGRTLRLIYIY
jgi:hypothetical protein